MNWQRSPDRTAERAAALALFACGVLAIGNLPASDLTLGWLIAWTAPAMAFGCLRRQSQRPWLRALAAAAVQITAFAVALRYAGDLSRPAILACTILPPLAFVIVRRRDADAALGLFLSFCVLLVGVILGGTTWPILGGYCVAACVSLRCEAFLAARAVTHKNRSPASSKVVLRSVVFAGLAVAVPCLFAAFAFERTLGWLPSPLRSPDGSATASDPNGKSPRRQGLDDSFNLNGGGVLADLAGEQLVLVRTDNGSPVPSDLYLRSGFFAVAELDRWQIGLLSRERPKQLDHVLRQPDPRSPVRWLEIERFAGARNFIFVPPDAVSLRAVPALEFDPRRMWLRQGEQGEQTDYAVSYQELPRPGDRDHVEPSASELGLLGCPEGLDRQRYEALLEPWQATGSPWQIAQRIAAGLAQHCRYDRIEPTGPYRHTIDNFLFAEGERRGYCMHFASAAALMLRLRGVPCRIGVGLYGGQLDRQDAEARIYGSQHAHAWVEIPFQGRGYVVFDPTPPEERGRRMPSRTDQEGLAGQGDETANVSTGDLWRGLVEFVTQPWFLLLVLLLAVAAQLWPASRTSQPEVVLPRSTQTARRLLVRILRALADAGHLRMRGQTLEQFGASLAARQRLAPEVAGAFRSYQEIRFGGYAFDSTRESVMKNGLATALLTKPPVDPIAD